MLEYETPATEEIIDGENERESKYEYGRKEGRCQRRTERDAEDHR